MTAPLVLPPDLPRKGDLLAGKYQVEEVLGAGGMGVVVAARHLALRQRVAVKFLLPAAARLPEASTRFLREARAAVAIQSEHVARVIDVGTLETGAPYMVMEYLAGTDFSRLIKQRGPLPVADAVDFVLQAGEAIAEAHHLGIIHRDLKPANLFLTHRTEGSPLVKVLDFGLSKMTLSDEEAGDGSLTATSAVVGSPHYMSPEQIRSLKHVGTGTDLWALGVILHEMLTGRRPFEGKTLTSISASIVADAPIPVGSLRPDAPPGLDAVVLACLEKDLSHRVASVTELAARLAPFAPPRSGPSLERIAKLATVPRAAPDPALVPGEDDGDAEPTRALAAGSQPAGVEPVPLGESAILSVSAPAVQPPAPAPAPAPAAVIPAAFETEASAWGQTQPQGKGVGKAAVAAVAVGAAAVLTLAGWLAFSGPAKQAAPAAASTATAAPLVTEPSSPLRLDPPPPPPEPPRVAPAPPAPTETAKAATSATAHAAAPAPAAIPRAVPRRPANPLDRSD